MNAPTHPLPDAALDGDIAILGRKGGGKTYSAKGIVEHLLDLGRRVLVLDPLGVWAGLRTAADGQNPGYRVAIFGGQHGDRPLDPGAATAMATVLASENVPAVIDLSDLSKTAQQSFLLKFLHELRRVNVDALTLVLEEADVFAPQNPQGDDSKQLHGEIDWIARRGRFKGFRLITVTQRPARLSKDVLTQCSTLVAHKLPAPQDRDAVKAWVDGNGDRDQARQVFDTLAALDVGEAWVYAPEHGLLQRVRFPRIKTLDTSATPKAGEKRIEPKTLADIDLTAIDAALAEATANDAAHKSKGGKSTIDQKAISDAEARGYQRGYGAGKVAGLKEVAMTFAPVRQWLDEIDRTAGALQSDPPAVLSTPRRSPSERAIDPVVSRAKPSPRAGGDGPNERGRPAGMKLLAALARYAAECDGLAWTDVCLTAGLLHGNGYFYDGKRWALDSGFAVEHDGLARITAEGLDAALRSGASPDRPSLSHFLDLWTPKLRAPGAVMLNYIASRRPNDITLQELASAIGLKPGNGYLYGGIAAIRDPGLIEQDGQTFRLSKLLREAQ